MSDGDGSGDLAREELIAGLNDDLAAEYQAIAGYATVIALLRVEVANRQQHACVLADAVTALGGEPTETPKPRRVSRDPRELLMSVFQSAAFASQPAQGGEKWLA
jgi:bacterioferritin